MAILTICAFLLLWLPEIPGMLHHKQTRIIVAFACVWALALTLALLVLYGVDVNQVTLLLRGIFEPIGRIVIVPPPT